MVEEKRREIKIICRKLSLVKKLVFSSSNESKSDGFSDWTESEGDVIRQTSRRRESDPLIATSSSSP